MGLFDFLKGVRDLGKKKAAVAEVPAVSRAPLSPYREGAGILERAFLGYQRRQRLHRGRVHAPKELQDRPTAGGQLATLDAFLYYGEWVPLTSSWIESARYDLEQLELTLTFADARTSPRGVVVSDVSWSEAREFITAPSHGMWVHDHVIGRPHRKGDPTRKPVRRL